MMSCCFDPAYEYTTAAGLAKSICERRISLYCSGADLGVPDDMASLVCDPDEGSQGLHPGSMNSVGTALCGCAANGMESCCFTSTPMNQSVTPGAACCSAASVPYQGSVCFCNVSFVWDCPGLDLGEPTDGGAGD